MQPKVLICPLDWGLGHAGRMVPLIRSFLQKGCKVTVAASGGAAELLRREFPVEVKHLPFPGFNISYSSQGYVLLKLLWQFPFFVISVIREYQYTKKLVKQLHPDLIVSDNRYGVRYSKVFSVFVTHQLFFQMPSGLSFMATVINRLNHYVIGFFDVCMVPDFAQNPGLSGVLSHWGRLPHKTVYAGPLSRFDPHKRYDVGSFGTVLPKQFILVILSGPEPQRTEFEEKLKAELVAETVVWFRALPHRENFEQTGNHYFFNHGTTELMGYCLQKSSLVISRSGYSTVMDLAVFEKKAILVPTPAQTEQIYLGRMLNEQNKAICLDQRQLSGLKEALTRVEGTTGMKGTVPNTGPDGVVERLLEMIYSKQA